MPVKPTPLSAADAQHLAQLIDRISLLGGLSPSQVDQVIKSFKKQTFCADQRIFTQGDPASYIYIVLSGAVELDFAGDCHPLSGHQLTPGQCFGETSVIGIQRHAATTRAVTETELVVLSRDELMRLFQSDSQLFSLLILNIARESCRRLSFVSGLLSGPLLDQPHTLAS